MTVPVLVVFLATSLISLGRIVVTNRNALSDLVWAEDGLFPLCIDAHGYLPCLTDQYEGYFLFLSRTLAVPVSFFPLSSWPLVTNILAALSFGALSSLIAWLLLRAQFSRTVAVGSAIGAVLLPIVGLETINTAGSAYMLLLIAATIATSFTFSPPLRRFIVPALLFVSALTIPSSLVLALPIVAAPLIHKGTGWTAALRNLATLGAGLFIQFAFILTAPNPRPVAISLQSMTNWVEQYPKALLSFMPNVAELDEWGQLSVSFYENSLWVGFATLIAYGAITVVLLAQSNRQLRGAGLLSLTGFLMGLIPAISGYPINRYFVIPVVTLFIAILIWLGTTFQNKRAFLPTVIVAALFVLWIPSFGASPTRSDASPRWGDVLPPIQAQCASDGAGIATFTFTPNWPFSNADFRGPTSNNVPCQMVNSN